MVEKIAPYGTQFAISVTKPMKFFDFFRFQKDTRSAAPPVVEVSAAQATVPIDIEYAPPHEPIAIASKRARKAIAILPYNNFNYFKEVLDSMLIQTINGAPFSEVYELFVFQDGLQVRHHSSLAAYDAIKTLCHEKLPTANFMRQPKNIGTALQFAYVATSPPI